MSKSYQTQISDLAEILGISDQLHQPVSTLSGGMKRKFEIIRALLHQPKVLFLDEPTTGLDPISRQQLWQYLQQVRKTHQTTIFLTTHYLDEAEPASQICILNRGKIVAQGSPQAIKDQLISHQISVTSSNTKKLHRLLHQHKLKFSGSDPTIIYPDNPNPASIINLLPRDITSFQHHHPTLEQAYIQIINKPETNV